MKSTTLNIFENSSVQSELGTLIISVRTTYGNHCEVVIGSPGTPNVVQDMKTGDAVLFESPTEGILEVRALNMNTARAEFLVTQVSPRPGLMAGLTDEDPNNLKFTVTERRQIADSLNRVRSEIHKLQNISQEQVDLISRKLDEMNMASERLGRKDWINYVIGTLTSIGISAAFAPDTMRAVFHSVNAAFTWLFNSPVVFLP